MADKFFQFKDETGVGSFNYRKRQKRFSLWFQKKVFIGSLISLFLFIQFNLFPHIKKNKAKDLTPVRNVASEPLEKIHISEFFVNLKNDKGVRLARVSLDLEVTKKAVRKELLSNHKMHKYILLLLSGKNSKDIQEKKSAYEKEILSHLNAFLSKGRVNKVVLYTTMVN